MSCHWAVHHDAINMKHRYPLAHAPRTRATRLAQAHLYMVLLSGVLEKEHLHRHYNGYYRRALARAVLTSISNRSMRSVSIYFHQSVRATVHKHRRARRFNTVNTAHHLRHSLNTHGINNNMKVLLLNQHPAHPVCPNVNHILVRPAQAIGQYNSLNTTRPRVKDMRYFHKCTNKVHNR